MELEYVISLISQYGYAALFFCLWLGIIGLPIPDEVIVMTGGLVGSLGLLEPIPAFFVTYLGVISGLTIGYVLGRIMGVPALHLLKKKKGIERYVDKSYELIDRYGSYSLCISYFFPIVRHVVPYLVGIGRMPFFRYSLYSFTTGFVWTLFFFVTGSFFGAYINKIGQTVHRYGLTVLFSALVIGAMVICCWYVKKIKRVS